LAQAALKELAGGGEEGVERELADGHVERGEAEFAGERAAARGFEVDDAMGEVVVVVKIVRELELGEVGDLGGDNFGGRFLTTEEGAAEIGEFEIGFARNDVIGQADDFLCFGFVTNFGSAEDDGETGADAFEGGDDFGSGCDVPNVDADADDLRVLGEDGFDDFEWALLEIEFEDGGQGAEWTEVGEQIAQAKGGVDVARVESGQDDLRHGGNIGPKGGMIKGAADCGLRILVSVLRQRMLGMWREGRRRVGQC